MLIQPLVSVIMPVYNAEEFINAALDSILDQTYANLEILIADDGSTDQSRNIINSYTDQRINVFHNETNIGYLKTCNRLFEHVTGEYIAFQDADDWSEPTRIEKTIEFLLSHPETAMCGCNFIRTNVSSQSNIFSSDYPLSDADIKHYISCNQSVPFCGATVVVRNEIYNSIGGYRQFFNRLGGEDFDWFLLISEKHKVANIPDSLYHYRYVPSSVSRNNVVRDYKKYYINSIIWFLREQRVKHGYDALQNSSLKPEFDNFLSSIEQEYTRDRFSVYKRLIISRFYNNDFKSAFNLYTSGIEEQNIKAPVLTAFFLAQTIKALVKRIAK